MRNSAAFQTLCKKLVLGFVPVCWEAFFPQEWRTCLSPKDPWKPDFDALVAQWPHVVTSGGSVIHRCFCCRGGRNLTPARQLSPAMVSTVHFCSSSFSRQYLQEWGCCLLKNKTVLASELTSNTSSRSFFFPGHWAWELGPVQTAVEDSTPMSPHSSQPISRDRGDLHLDQGNTHHRHLVHKLESIFCRNNPKYFLHVYNPHMHFFYTR